MSNFKIAIDWSIKTVLGLKMLVLSDQFFTPFKRTMRERLIRDLDAKGVLVWAVEGSDMAILTPKDDPRLARFEQDGQVGGVWTDGDQVTVLPIQNKKRRAK